MGEHGGEAPFRWTLAEGHTEGGKVPHDSHAQTVLGLHDGVPDGLHLQPAVGIGPSSLSLNPKTGRPKFPLQAPCFLFSVVMTASTLQTAEDFWVVGDVVFIVVVLDGGFHRLLRQHRAMDLMSGQAVQRLHHRPIG